MNRALLDVNVLLALIDVDHIDRARAHEWFGGVQQSGWSSCAITQNGFVRILSQPKSASSVSTPEATALLLQACSSTDHEFWPCDISIIDRDRIDRTRVHGPKQLTDVYLLALAVEHGGTFVTFDRRVPVSAVPGANPVHLTTI